MNEEVKNLVNKIKFLYNTNQKGVAELVGIDYRYLSNVLNGRYPLSEELKTKLCKLSKDREGEEFVAGGIYFGGDGVAPDLSQAVPFIGDGFENVVAGSLSGYGIGIQARDITDLVALPTLPGREGDLAVRTRGRSMIDKQHPEQSINDGSIVCVRPWTEKHIQWGEIYCIATSGGYAVKRLMPADDDDCILCVSSNEEEGYKPYSVEKRDIQGIGKVTAIINLQLL